MNEEDLLNYVRLKVVECGDCWEWQGAKSAGGRPIITKKGKHIQARRLIAQTMGMPVGKKLVSNKCNNKLCVAPEHILLLTRSQLSKRAVKLTDYASRISFGAAISKGKRKRSRLTQEIVNEIRASDEPGRAIAKRIGIDPKTVADIRKYVFWKDYSNPFFQLAA